MSDELISLQITAHEHSHQYMTILLHANTVVPGTSINGKYFREIASSDSIQYI